VTRTRRTAAPILALILLAGAACQSDSDKLFSKPVAETHGQPAPAAAATPVAQQAAPTAPTAERPQRREPPAARAASAPSTAPAEDFGISRALRSAGTDAETFFHHVATLADPFFEGRSADTRGKELAAEYVRFYFTRAGLQPAFSEALAPDADIEPMDAGPAPENPHSAPATVGMRPAHLDSDNFNAALNTSFNQAFTVPGPLTINSAEVRWSGGDNADSLELGKDFNPLGMSGNAIVTAPLVFAGYAIDRGPDNYSSYAEDENLDGRIAMIFRFEPMNAYGKSKWADGSGSGNWSPRSGLIEKVRSALARGASGVIVVGPPGADDPRADRLETPRATRLGQVQQPVVMITAAAAQRLLKAADPEGRSLLKFRQLADDGWRGAIPLDNAGLRITLKVDMERQRLSTHNVGAILPGKGTLADEYVVIGAHYDHVGYGFLAGASPANVGKLHPGADDNASGTAGLIMLAQRLKADYDKLPDNANARSILFLAFAAEEMGLLGAQHFVRNTGLSSSQMTAMLNMDMIGRLNDNKLQISGTGTADEWTDILNRAEADATANKRPLTVSRSPGGQGPSDHSVFYRSGIPVLHFFTGTHSYYHQPSDVISIVNAEGAARVLDLIHFVATDLVTRPTKPIFQESAGGGPQGPRTASRVRLGIQPGDYDDSEPGVLIGGVTEGSAADKAGVRAGDRLVRWNGQQIIDIYGMMDQLSKHRPGDVIELLVIRDGAEVTLKPTLEPAQAIR